MKTDANGVQCRMMLLPYKLEKGEVE